MRADIGKCMSLLQTLEEKKAQGRGYLPYQVIEIGWGLDYTDNGHHFNDEEVQLLIKTGSVTHFHNQGAEFPDDCLRITPKGESILERYITNLNQQEVMQLLQ